MIRTIVPCTVTCLAIVALAVGCKTASRRVADNVKSSHTCAPPVTPRTAWRHDRSRLMAGAFTARHSASDVVAAPGAALELRGKLVYGKASKDLEDEEVVLWIDDGSCKPSEVARGITDDDGRVTFTVPGRQPGTYQFWIAVGGDGTAAPGAIWVVPPGQRAVLFDVDGTLTTSDGELFEELAGGTADMFPDADGVARHWADAGHLVIYVTGRPYLLQESTRAWLDAHGLPPGPLFTPARLRQAVPSQGGVGVYKTAVLTDLRALGLDIVRAYGNAATDVCAYAASGIAPDVTYIVGADAKRCDPHPPTRPLPSYTDHLRALASPP